MLRHISFTALVALLALSAMTIPGKVMAAVVHVDVDAAGAGNGLTWTDAFTSLQDGIAAALPGDQVWVASGTYHPTVEVAGTGDRFLSFQLKNDVAVYGGFEGDESNLAQRDWAVNPCILSGDIGISGDEEDNCLHVFHHPPGFGLLPSARLDGFTITGGNANLVGGDSRKGGGMYNEDSEPTVANCTFTANQAGGSSYARGGAMYNHYCSPTVLDCAFTDNECYSAGGAIYNAGYSAAAAAPLIRGCYFEANRAGGGGNGDGGAIYNATACQPIIVDCTFVANEALYNGGAILNYGGGGGGQVVNCVFADNTAGLYGGAIYNAAGTELTCANTVFNRNLATASNGHGGALYNIACDPVFVNCVLYANQSGCVGKSVYDIQFADAVFANCIVEGEWAFYNGGDCDVQITYCCLEQAGFEDPALHNVYAPPLLADPANDDFHLLPGSPCLDAGDNLALPADAADLDGDHDVTEPLPCDFEGDPRCQDDADTADSGNGEPPLVDIGADELGSPVGVAQETTPRRGLGVFNRPNPFNPRTEICFVLPATSPVELRIYAIDGTLVRLLETGTRPVGANSVVWDGLDDAGRPAVSGIYVCRVSAAGRSAQIRMALVR